MMSPDEWRAQVAESAVDPELPIIDAHHHLWPRSPFEGYEAYPDAALIGDVTGSGHNVVATVCVEAHGSYRTSGPHSLQPVGETEYAEGLARRVRLAGGRGAGICAAIVAHADLRLGDAVDEVLDAHFAASPDRLRGIRHMAAHDPDLQTAVPTSASMLAEPQVRNALHRLAHRNLSFDAWVVHSQLQEVADLARALPNLRIILDHLGSPIRVGRFRDRPGESFKEWRTAVSKVAACSNVSVKLGGLHVSVSGFSAADAARPRYSIEMANLFRDHILTAIDLFGPERAMFESNFPVDRMSGPYGVLWNTFKRITAGFSASDRAALFAGTARRVYRIDARQELANDG